MAFLWSKMVKLAEFMYFQAAFGKFGGRKNHCHYM